MNEGEGKSHWVFADGGLPSSGGKEPFGHGALIVVNLNRGEAELPIDILFEDKEPVKGIKQALKGEKIICIRLDKPIREQRYEIPKGQYALVLNSNIPVVAVFGRLDVRQPNLAYYSVQGYSF